MLDTMPAPGRLLLALGALAACGPPRGGRGPGAPAVALAGHGGLTLLSGGGRTALGPSELVVEADVGSFQSDLNDATPFLTVTYSDSMQPVVDVSVGGQWLKLVFDASSGNTVVFVAEDDACQPKGFEPCFSYKAAEANASLKICEENNVMVMDCSRQGSTYPCTSFLPSLAKASPHTDELIIDGLEYDQKSVEALEDMSFRLLSGQGTSVQSQTLHWQHMPIRLLVGPMAIPSKPPHVALDLFSGVSGILGASGQGLSCRNDTLWTALLRRQNVTRFSLDFAPPAAAIVQDPGVGSRVVLNEVDLARGRQDLIWSQPKQVGDVINDGLHEFLLYHLEVCDVSLLYNTSSNWLTVIDTSGPCLSLPPFLFERLRSRIPVDCPFAPGESSEGRLCQPRRNSSGAKLPSLHFRLEDVREPEPPSLWLPLERLVFKNASGDELLCVARDDTDARWPSADMMSSHIALGSLAISALYTVVDLENHTVGLSSKGNLETEASDAMCAVSRTCIGDQSYFPPLNICEDPLCSMYMLMSLDEATKKCRWSRIVPVGFGFVLVLLVGMDLLSHRLYKQAIERSSEFNQ